MASCVSLKGRWYDFGAFGPVLQSSTDCRLRHLAMVFGVTPNALLNVASEASDRYDCSHCVRGRGAAMTYLSHKASLHPQDEIIPLKAGTIQKTLYNFGRRIKTLKGLTPYARSVQSLRDHLQMLGVRPITVQHRSDPSNAGNEQQNTTKRACAGPVRVQIYAHISTMVKNMNRL